MLLNFVLIGWFLGREMNRIVLAISLVGADGLGVWVYADCDRRLVSPQQPFAMDLPHLLYGHSHVDVILAVDKAPIGLSDIS